MGWDRSLDLLPPKKHSTRNTGDFGSANRRTETTTIIMAGMVDWGSCRETLAQAPPSRGLKVRLVASSGCKRQLSVN